MFSFRKKTFFTQPVLLLAWGIPNQDDLLHQLLLLGPTQVVLVSCLAPVSLTSEDLLLEVSENMDMAEENNTSLKHRLQDLKKFNVIDVQTFSGPIETSNAT